MGAEALAVLLCADRQMLCLRVSAYQDGTPEVSGVFGDSFVSENQHQGVGSGMQSPTLRFQALLIGGVVKVSFERGAAARLQIARSAPESASLRIFLVGRPHIQGTRRM